MSQDTNGNNGNSNNTGKDKNSSSVGMLKENHTLVIAIIVIVPFMFFFGYVLLVFKDVMLLEKMTALLSGLVAAVLGYYFGQRPVQQLTEQVKKSGEESQQNKNLFNGSKEELLDLIEDFEDIRKENEELRTMMEKG